MSGQNPLLTFDKEYTGTTQNVVKSVLIKKAEAGVTLNTELNKEAPDVLRQIRTILETQDIPSHPVAAHPRVPQPVQEAVRKAILSLDSTSADAKLLREVWLASPVTTTYEDYCEFEEIDVKKNSNWGK